MRRDVRSSLCVAIVMLMSISVPLHGLAQGFAGLGTDSDGFAQPQRNPAFEFPADHGPHPDYRIEWWYLTANLTAQDGTAYGLQWTLFRSALAPGEGDGWTSPQIWFAHAAVTTPERHFATERFARGGTGQAGVTAEPFSAWIDEWHLQGPDLDRLSLAASGPDFAYDMQLQANGPLVFHGEDGFSQKSALGQASYYYSQPFFEIEGTLTLPDGAVSVSGSAWLDREWSSQPLADSQTGWDWFSLVLDDGDRLMGFRLRDDASGDFTAATWIGRDGTSEAYEDGALQAIPMQEALVEGRMVPVRWRLLLPERDLDVVVEALNPQSWMSVSIPYWEGPVRVEGTHAGRGYLEMTGYQ